MPALHSDCPDENAITEFMEGVLPERDRAALERHFAQCDECRMLVAELARSPSFDAHSPTAPAGPIAHITLDQGQKVGRFEVLSRIGSGGMGVVFAAYDPRLGRKVALKLLRSAGDDASSSEGAQTRLLREAQAIAQLSHPNVIHVYDVGTYQDEVYIAMEFVEGSTLTVWLRRYERPWQDTVSKFVDAGRGLASAHASGLAHRDFKPDNVLVGEDESVRVMDFGLARSLFFENQPPMPVGRPGRTTPLDGVPALSHRLTETGALLGTPRYMAPEQFLGHEADARSDQFSFCVALFEALYQRHPFERGTAELLAVDAAAAPLRSPPDRTDVPRWLHRVLVRGMAREPRERSPSMNALLRAVTSPPRSRSRFRVVAVGALTALVLSTIGYAMSVLIADRDAARRAAASAEDEVHRLTERLEVVQTELGEVRQRIQRTAKRDDELRELQEREQLLVEQIGELRLEIEELARPPTPRAPRAPPVPQVRSLPVATIARYTERYRRDLEVCMQEWRERAPGDRPMLAVQIEVNADGSVIPGSRSGGIDDQVVHACVTGVLEHIVFPPHDAITTVQYGFELAPDKSISIDPRVVDARPVAARAGRSPEVGARQP